MAIRQIRAGRRPLANVATYVGETGHIFYDETAGILRLSDGSTPGGLNIAVPIATSTRVGGIKPSPGIIIDSEGRLFIDSSGLSFNFGDFIATVGTYPDSTQYGVLSTIYANEDMFLESNGTGSVGVIGEFNVYKTDGDIPGATAIPPIFTVKADGQIQMLVPGADSAEGALSIVGGLDGVFQAPVNAGVMLHITGIAGSPGVPSRVYNDAQNAFAAFVARRYNNTAASPSAVLDGEEIMRLSGTAHNGTLIPASANQRITFKALGNQTLTNQGGTIEFATTPLNSTTLTTVATIDNANGFTVTKANITGNANTGNLGTGTVIATTANLTTINSGLLQNGTSNVTVNSNGNVNISVGSNVLTVTSSGANIAGTLNTGTGNANVGNLGTATAIITTGNITTINSGLVQNGNSNVTITANSNVSVFVNGNATARAVFTSTGANIAGTANITGNANVGNLGTAQVLATANVTSPQLISNVATGTAPLVVTSTTQVSNLNVAVAGSLINGTSNVSIINNGNVNISASGNANVLTITGSSVVISGSFSSNDGISDGIGNVRSVPLNSQTGAYQLAATDNGKMISITTGGITVPAGVFASPFGQIVSIFNDSVNSQTITQGASVTLRLAGTLSTGNRTLARYGIATITCVAANTFVISGAGIT